MIEFSSAERMQRYLEPIDVENDEYEAWRADGRLLKLATGKSRQTWLLLESTSEVKDEQSLQPSRRRPHVEHDEVAEVPSFIRLCRSDFCPNVGQ